MYHIIYLENWRFSRKNYFVILLTVCMIAENTDKHMVKLKLVFSRERNLVSFNIKSQKIRFILCCLIIYNCLYICFYNRIFNLLCKYLNYILYFSINMLLQSLDVLDVLMLSRWICVGGDAKHFIFKMSSNLNIIFVIYPRKLTYASQSARLHIRKVRKTLITGASRRINSNRTAYCVGRRHRRYEQAPATSSTSVRLDGQQPMPGAGRLRIDVALPPPTAVATSRGVVPVAPSRVMDVCFLCGEFPRRFPLPQTESVMWLRGRSFAMGW